MDYSYWVKKSSDFDLTIKKGQKTRSHSYFIFWKPNNLKHFRVGISVSKKISKLAVVRNKIKRQIRSFFYTHQIKIDASLDVVIIVSKGYDLTKYSLNLLELKNKLKNFNKI